VFGHLSTLGIEAGAVPVQLIKESHTFLYKPKPAFVFQEVFRFADSLGRGEQLVRVKWSDWT